MSGTSSIPSSVFIDISAFFALIDTREASHRRAVSVTESARRRMFTTNFVVAETHALLVRRLGRTVATQFLNDMDQGRTVVIRVDAADEQRARAIIISHDNNDYSLTDAISFAVMERLDISEAFTFDRHLRSTVLSCWDRSGMKNPSPGSSGEGMKRNTSTPSRRREFPAR